MTSDTALKALERPCRECGTTMPAQPSGPGRPKEFCGFRCRRTWHSRQERAAEQRARDEEKERHRFETDLRFYGVREARRRARERAERIEGRS